MPQGTITKIVSDRGFGFISAGESGKEEVFFHHSSVADAEFDNLQIGQAVEFEVEDQAASGRRGKGPRASSVKPA